MVHISTREALENQVRDLGLYTEEEIEAFTDDQLIDALRAEKAAEDWLSKFAMLPSDEARRDAADRLNIDQWPQPRLPGDERK